MEQIELSWVLGWVSAAGTYLGATLGGQLRHTDADAIAASLDKYCRENPLKNITDASLSLVLELSKPE